MFSRVYINFIISAQKRFCFLLLIFSACGFLSELSHPVSCNDKDNTTFFSIEKGLF